MTRRAHTTPDALCSHAHAPRQHHHAANRSLHGAKYGRRPTPLLVRFGLAPFPLRHQTSPLQAREPTRRAPLTIAIPPPRHIIRHEGITSNGRRTSQEYFPPARTNTLADMILRDREPYALQRARRPLAKRSRLRLRTLLCALYGTLFAALLVALLILEAQGSPTPSKAITIPLILLDIALAIFFFHSLLRLATASRSWRSLSSASSASHSSRSADRRKTVHHALRCARSSRTVADNRGRSRAERPRRDTDASASAARILQRIPAAHGPDRLPDTDELYSPITPCRVHMADDDQFDDKHAAAISIEAIPHSPYENLEQHVVSPIIQVDFREEHGAQVQGAITTEQIGHHGILADQSSLRAPPPAYGLWRCSVRADPNLLHWRRVDSLNEFAGRTPPVSPMSPLYLRQSVPVQGAEEARRLHDPVATPPAYDSLREPDAVELPAHVESQQMHSHDLQGEYIVESAAAQEARRSMMSAPGTAAEVVRPEQAEVSSRVQEATRILLSSGSALRS